MDTEKNPETFIPQGEKIETRGRKRLPEGRKKVQRNISVDSSLWDEAVSLLPGEVSGICERAIRRAVKAAKRKAGHE